LEGVRLGVSQQRVGGLKRSAKTVIRKINMEELQKELIEKIKVADIDKLKKLSELFPDPCSIIVLTLIERIAKLENNEN
jgi:hypothetical protein